MCKLLVDPVPGASNHGHDPRPLIFGDKQPNNRVCYANKPEQSEILAQNFTPVPASKRTGDRSVLSPANPALLLYALL